MPTKIYDYIIKYIVNKLLRPALYINVYVYNMLDAIYFLVRTKTDRQRNCETYTKFAYFDYFLKLL